MKSWRLERFVRANRFFIIPRSHPVMSPHGKESKIEKIVFGFQIPLHGFRIPGTWFQSFSLKLIDSGFQLLVGFRITWAVFQFSKGQDSWFSRVPESLFLYMRRSQKMGQLKTTGRPKVIVCVILIIILITKVGWVWSSGWT